jgi:hypothetical protein
VLTILTAGGRAAVELPDNYVFADQAGELFQAVTEDCDLHTVLRPPAAVFGVTQAARTQWCEDHFWHFAG